MGRRKKVEPMRVFKKPILAEGKHLDHNHISKIKCFLDDPGYTNLDIALAVGVRVGQVKYIARKLRKGIPVRNEFKDCPLRRGYIRRDPYLE